MNILALARKKPLLLLLFPFWLLKGIAYLKEKVAEQDVLDFAILPYKLNLVSWLSEQKAKGNKIVLCTAASHHIAREVAKCFDLFDEVIASDKNTNLKSINKLNALQERYGDKGYDYAGNSNADLAVWAGASNAIVVHAGKRLLNRASQFDYAPSRYKKFLNFAELTKYEIMLQLI